MIFPYQVDVCKEKKDERLSDTENPFDVLVYEQVRLESISHIWESGT